MSFILNRLTPSLSLCHIRHGTIVYARVYDHSHFVGVVKEGQVVSCTFEGAIRVCKDKL